MTKKPEAVRRNLFGTDGIRGRANQEPMLPEMILKLGQAIGSYFRQKYDRPKIVIGKDTRRSGYMLEQALSAGICSVGVDTFFLGPLPTPGIAYLTRGMRANAGIVISASHNPYYDNGIKIFSNDGYKLPDEAEAELERLAFGESIRELPTGRSIGRSRRIDDAIGQYSVFLKEQFPKHLTLAGLRIVVDCANGAGYKVAPKVFEELGAEVFVQGNRPDGFNINDQCGALHPEKLIAAVKLYKADLGLALDGDADRLVLVDEKGEVVDGDEIMAICATYYISLGKLKENTVVSTIMSNLGLDIALNRAGGRLIRTDVGDRYVVEAMVKGGYNLGGEQSGHLVFRDCSTTGDGILAALHILQVMLEKGSTINELKKCMHRLPQVLRSFDVDEKVPVEKMPVLAEAIKDIESQLGKTGRVLFRYSGTEKKARIMVEGDDLEAIQTMANHLSETTMSSIANFRRSIS
jgi:phosphoglucosamine mutase